VKFKEGSMEGKDGLTLGAPLDNQVGPEGTAKLAQALQQNTTLTLLDLASMEGKEN